MPESQSQPRRRYLAGVVALLAVVFIWVSSSFVMNVKWNCSDYETALVKSRFFANDCRGQNIYCRVYLPI